MLSYPLIWLVKIQFYHVVSFSMCRYLTFNRHQPHMYLNLDCMNLQLNNYIFICYCIHQHLNKYSWLSVVGFIFSSVFVISTGCASSSSSYIYISIDRSPWLYDFFRPLFLIFITAIILFIDIGLIVIDKNFNEYNNTNIKVDFDKALFDICSIIILLLYVIIFILVITVFPSLLLPSIIINSGISSLFWSYRIYDSSFGSIYV